MNDPSQSPHIDPALPPPWLCVGPSNRRSWRKSAGPATSSIALGGQTVYLRLTGPSFRTPVENQAECDFLSHLNRGVAVALPIPSQRDRDVEPIEGRRHLVGEHFC
ncbi:MAG: hypothetical protein R2838_22675 [Caldilineaceae bacterium]